MNASGYCQYIPPGILKSTCYIDVRWFPFDVQKCDLKFGSWTHNGWLLDLQMLDVDTSTYIPNGEWDLVGKTETFFPQIFFIRVLRCLKRFFKGFNNMAADAPNLISLSQCLNNPTGTS